MHKTKKAENIIPGTYSYFPNIIGIDQLLKIFGGNILSLSNQF